MNFTQTHDIETSIIRKLDNPFTFSSPRPLITKLGRRIRITIRTCITVFSQKRVKKRCHPSAESSKSATLFSKVKTRDLIPCSLPFFFNSVCWPHSGRHIRKGWALEKLEAFVCHGVATRTMTRVCSLFFTLAKRRACTRNASPCCVRSGPRTS